MGDPEQRIYHVTARGLGKLVWDSWRRYCHSGNGRVEWGPEDWQLTKPVTDLFVLLKTREVINEE